MAVFLYVILTQIFDNKGKPVKIFLTSVKNNLVILAGFLIGWSPLLAFEFRHNFLDFKNMTEFLLHSGNTGANPNFFYNIYDVFFRLFGRLVFYFPPKEQFLKYNPSILELWTGIVLLFSVLSTILLLRNLYQSFKLRKDDFNKYLLVFLWGFIGILLFGFYKKPIYDYYFAFMFPLPFILVGGFIFQMYELKKIKNIGKLLAVLILLFVILLNLRGVPFRYSANRQLNQAETIARFVNDKTEGKPFNFALITGGNSDHAYRYFFTIWGHQPVTIENSFNDPKRTTVTNQLLVVCESLPCYPLGNSLWEVAGFGQADIAGHWNVSVVEVYRLVHHKGK
jgi:hypothetical protein